MAAHRLQGFAQETIGRSSIPSVCQHEVDELTVLIDSSKQLFPFATDSNISLIYAPRPGTGTLIATDPLLDLGRIALNPAEDRGWVDLYTALLHHLGEIAVADAVLAVPAHAEQDDLNWEVTALEQRQRGGSLTNRPSFYGRG